MGEPTPSQGAFAQLRRKLNRLAYSRSYFGVAGRGLRMLFTLQFGALYRKLFSERHVAWPSGRMTNARPGPPLYLAGHIHTYGGYDHLVVKSLMGLINAGVNVIRDPRAAVDPKLVPAGFTPAERMYTWDVPRLAIIPPYLLYTFCPGENTATWTMWETDKLPDGCTKHLNKCGLLLIPSQWGVNCFRANGVTVPMEVAPLGYDPEVYSPRPPASGPQLCTFGTAGALDQGGLRKNVQRVIDLFRNAFPDRPDVRLKVKITPRSPMVNTHGDPRVEVVNTSLTPAAMADWYRSLTCYVNASYGEGFGLHLLEAMGCGVPLISTTFSAVGEMFDSRVGYEVSHKLIEAKNRVYSGLWGDPDNDELIARMREVYADRDTADRLGMAAAQRATEFSWSESIRRLTLALAKHGLLPADFGQSGQRATA